MYEIVLKRYFVLVSRPYAFIPDDKLKGIVGRHSYCGGDIILGESDKRILFCNRCENNLVIPPSVETYKHLQEFTYKIENSHPASFKVDTINLSSWIDNKR
jgi:hypothetical protein